MNDKKSVSEREMQQYVIGELPQEKLEAFRARELCDGEFRARLDALRACHEQIKSKYPIEWTVRKLELRAESRKTERAKRPADNRGAGSLSWTRAAVPLFACIALMAAIPVYMFSTGNNPFYKERIKGGGNLRERINGGELIDAPVLHVWRKTASSQEMLADGDVARQGDILQLWYNVPASCYGALVSVDGRGVLTVHLSGSDGKAVLLIPGRPVSLPTAYRLDDAPSYEAFYLITSSGEFDLESVKEAIRGMEHTVASIPEISLPEKQVTAFTLRKLNGRGT